MTKYVDIFEKEFIIFPANRTFHWWSYVVVRPVLALSVAQSGQTPPEQRNLPCILCFDSLHRGDSSKSYRKFYLAILRYDV